MRACPGGAQNTASTYDKVGNRLTQNAGGTTTTYAYNNLDELTSSTTGGTATAYGYDADGICERRLCRQRDVPGGRAYRG